MTISPYYNIEVISPTGETIHYIDEPVTLSAARAFNTVGNATLTILPDRPETFYAFNTRFKLHRTDGRYRKSLFGDTIWFLRKFSYQVSNDLYVIGLEDATTLLSNPIVAYTSETPYADKTLEEFALITYDDDLRIDNMMRQYVRENMGADALDATRINPLISVEVDRNAAPYGEKEASWTKLNEVLIDLARQSSNKGMDLYYDLLPQDDNTFLFRVWHDLRGKDRGFSSADAIVFSDEKDDLVDVEVTIDYSKMGTYCYVLGYDTGPAQIVEEVGNAAIVRADPFGRVEFTYTGSDSDVSTVLADAGHAALHGARPRRTIAAGLSELAAARYGDFRYGDQVGVQVNGRQYDCQISAIKMDWRNGVEILDIRLDGSESLWNSSIWYDKARPNPITVPPDHGLVPPPTPAPDVPPFGDDTIFYGDMLGFVMWDGAHVYRTWDLQAASPTWEFVDTGITGNIQLGQYIYVDADTVGMWLMTSDAIWYCADIMATTPSWSSVLAIATVQAADAALATGSVVFQTMFPYWSQPGYLCVATGPNTTSSQNPSYQHAYFWYTSDYGANWSQVDMSSYTHSVSIYTHGYMHAGLFAMNIHRSAGTIYCVRGTPNIGFQVENTVFYSNDLGATWSKGAILDADLNVSFAATSLLNPFPDTTDPSYAQSGSAILSKSTDEWATKSDITTPSGYNGMAPLWRPNKRTFDNTHILGWFQYTSDNHYHLLESTDTGANWSQLYDSGVGGGSIPNTPHGTVSTAIYNTPNGWPPDVDQWVLVRGNVTGGSPTGAVLLTLDNFATAPADKSGNLSTLLGGNNWTNGPADGFALPRMGVNA